MPSTFRILCVTKPRFIGDTLVAVPALRALARAHPDAQFTLLTGPPAAEAMQGCPYLESILAPQAGYRGVNQRHLIRQLRAQRFNAAFLFNRSFRSALYSWLARIPVRIGFATEGRTFLLTHSVPYDRSLREVENLLRLVRVYGAEEEAPYLELWISDEERLRAQQKFGLQPEGVWVGIQPGSNDPYVRCWAPERFAEVANALVRTHRVQIVLFGSEKEKPFAESMKAHLRVPPLDLVGQTTLREALALIASLHLWISSDTGLHHAAVALDVPSVGIYNSATIHQWGYQTRRHRSLWKPSSASRLNDAELRASLDAISAEKVLRVAEELLVAASVEG